jgi:hypothetical protein
MTSFNKIALGTFSLLGNTTVAVLMSLTTTYFLYKLF